MSLQHILRVPAGFSKRFSSLQKLHRVNSLTDPLLCNVPGRRFTQYKWSNSEWVAKLHRIIRGPSLTETLDTIYSLLARQCNVYAGLRVQRLQQMWLFYSSLYSETALQRIVVNFARRNMRTTRKPLYYLFGAACFTWDRDRLTDEDLKRYVGSDEKLLSQLYSSSTLQKTIDLPSWEPVIDNQNLKVWRKPKDSNYLYEYKVYAKFFDISARSFLRVNMDLDYRKVWDKLVIKLQLMDRDEETGTEVIHWISHFPFPMQSRDYVFVRRLKIDHRTKTMYLVSKAAEHPSVPCNKNHVRVTTFESSLVIRPHRTFDENGFDYILTYHDDPKAPFPTAAVKWMTAEGFPRFVESMHDAAKHLDSFVSKEEEGSGGTAKRTSNIWHRSTPTHSSQF
ncbi:putative stAR-related lipid transfer protein 7, mitochondrial [Apostichopus japonicus]|uniref:Phosphatidylcholine transfer protein n=1 Tax=Stichopus japonicus TaxID=307972 RepID=A0A2G8JF52_STIJA|nr:putative stAR-related lipid transfer protein 7, mitochondrial [Apostichopus japonicus]